jgi:hypothetical protein
MGLNATPGQPAPAGVGIPPTLFLRVDGPGQLRVSEKDTQGLIRLAGGRIHQAVSYDNVHGVRVLLQQIGNGIMNRVAAAKGESSRKLFGGHTYSLIQSVVARVLGETIDMKHGGAFVFLPTKDRNADALDIQCKYQTAFNLGDFIVEFWCACVTCSETNDISNDLWSPLTKWRSSRERLFASAVTLAGLTAVDGCVVLNHNLDVLGFGGRICLSESDEKVVNSPRKLKNVETGAVLDDAEIASIGLGTRHGSAFRLCKAHSGSLAFVISQDGDLRVFYSDNEFVYGFEQLHAWVDRSGVL